jgi:hypothetical protein
VCVVDATAKIVKEVKVTTDPHILVTFFKGLGIPVTRIGLEAGPLAQWLYAGLTQAGFEVVLLETRHVKAALSAMVVKTDRKDARGTAQLLRMGWYQAVHAKSASSQEIRALLAGRYRSRGSSCPDAALSASPVTCQRARVQTMSGSTTESQEKGADVNLAPFFHAATLLTVK